MPKKPFNIYVVSVLNSEYKVSILLITIIIEA